MKTIDQYFYDWESSVFGFGYGTGEEHTLTVLKNFMNSVADDGTYDYKILEKCCGQQQTWLMLNIFAHKDLIEYGTSIRYGWLTKFRFF